jgi:hypothetical protein
MTHPFYFTLIIITPNHLPETLSLTSTIQAVILAFPYCVRIALALANSINVRIAIGVNVNLAFGIFFRSGT